MTQRIVRPPRPFPRASAAALLLTLLFLDTGQARADLIDFSYSWTVQPAVITGPPTNSGFVMVSAAPDGNGSYDTTAATATAIPGATITTSSSATNPPDTFNTPFNVTLHLTDTTSGASKDLTFSGTVKGTLTATSASLTSTFSNPLTQTVNLGQNAYTVTIDPTLSNLPGPTSTTPALIDALVTAGHTGNPPPVTQSPEPSTLALSATAILGLAAQMLRKRRAA
jgi:hypothetical protein